VILVGPQGSHLGHLFFIYLTLMTCSIFLKMLGFSLMLMTCVLAALTIVVCFSRTWTVYRVGCREKKYDLNAGKCKCKPGEVSICHWR
jgi:hypothetical protein